VGRAYSVRRGSGSGRSDALIPDWKEKAAPIKTKVRSRQLLYAGEAGKIRSAELSPCRAECITKRQPISFSMGTVLSLDGRAKAEALGVEIFPDGVL